jgi:hypothetical protein
MRFGTGLPRGEFTLLARCRATGRTTNREYLLWGEGLFHGEKIVPKTTGRGRSVLLVLRPVNTDAFPPHPVSGPIHN